MRRRTRLAFLAFLLVFVVSALVLVAALWGRQGAEDAVAALRAEKQKALQTERQTEGLRPSVSERPGETAQPPPPRFDDQGILIRYSALHAQNPDLAGWLTIPDTAVDYPVMRREGDYYLSHGFDGGAAPGGLPFIDDRCDPAETGHNLIIHGHNMKSGEMFHGLLDYTEADFAEAHARIRLDTLTEEQEYRVIAALRLPADPENPKGFSVYDLIDTKDEASVAELNRIIRRHGDYWSGETVAPGDDLLTLATCSYHVYDGRFVLVAKLETAR
ncbi:class B sortase [Oscillospiraceae bacterium OttesenSCG-928-F05]|nr:class B sortase [Oscillospiraceae bacterium OttesenSCG-928-F05]